MPRDVDEDLIEATIRRVAEQQAQREQVTEPPASAAAVQPGDNDEELEPGSGVEDDLIEATIRRVAAEKAARAQAPEHAPETESSPIEAVADTPVVVSHEPEDDWEEDPEPPPLRAVAGGRPQPAFVAARPVEHRADPVADDPMRQLASVVARLEAILPALERLANGASPAERLLHSVPERARSTPSLATQPQPHPAPEDRIDTRPLPQPLPPLEVNPRRGFDLLPRTYRITIEDKRRGVDLVPLHRSLLSMQGVKDMSLLSYTNGIAIIALEMTEDLHADALQSLVERAMSRAARVETHNEHTLVVKLSED